MLKELRLPFLIIVMTGVIFSLVLPYFPVDETRYLSVAWEMKLHDSLIVPLQNSLPYSHKPPLLFWLVNLNWLLLGVNEETLRFIPIGFSLLNVVLLYRIALLLWDDAEVARCAAVILSSTVSYLLWSALIMFDVVLTFWSLLALYGVLSAARGRGGGWWLLSGLAIGGGLLTKGPAILVYVLPAPLLAFLWVPDKRLPRGWYLSLLLSVLAGVALLLVWVVPAALTGGEAYRQAILWGQTVDRMASSFAHRRPFWWYLPWLPVLLLPWILLPSAWRGASRLAHDRASRFPLVWGLSTVAIFSLISGKQVHYLIPAVPACTLLMARNLVSADQGEGKGWRRHTLCAFYSLLGVMLCALPFTGFAAVSARAGISDTRPVACGLLAIGTICWMGNRGSRSAQITATAVSSLLLCTLVAAIDGSFLQRYDMHAISGAIREKQEEGYSILHGGKYHGQFHFIGRLKEPLVLVNDMDEIKRYAANHEKVCLITYEKDSFPVGAGDIYFKRPYRGRCVVMWNRRGIFKLIERNGTAGPSGRSPIESRYRASAAKRC